MNLIFLCGLFTFAVVLGFVSEEIKTQLRSVKAGNYAGTPFHHPWPHHTASLPGALASKAAECTHPYYPLLNHISAPQLTVKCIPCLATDLSQKGGLEKRLACFFLRHVLLADTVACVTSQESSPRST